MLHLCDAVTPGVVDWEVVTKGGSEEDKQHNAKYVLSVARKMGCAIFLLWEDVVEVCVCACVCVCVCVRACVRVLAAAYPKLFGWRAGKGAGGGGSLGRMVKMEGLQVCLYIYDTILYTVYCIERERERECVCVCVCVCVRARTYIHTFVTGEFQDAFNLFRIAHGPGSQPPGFVRVGVGRT